jgi:hypothetical protein
MHSSRHNLSAAPPPSRPPWSSLSTTRRSANRQATNGTAAAMAQRITPSASRAVKQVAEASAKYRTARPNNANWPACGHAERHRCVRLPSSVPGVRWDPSQVGGFGRKTGHSVASSRSQDCRVAMRRNRHSVCQRSRARLGSACSRERGPTALRGRSRRSSAGWQRTRESDIASRTTECRGTALRGCPARSLRAWYRAKVGNRVAAECRTILGRDLSRRVRQRVRHGCSLRHVLGRGDRLRVFSEGP